MWIRQIESGSEYKEQELLQDIVITTVFIAGMGIGKWVELHWLWVVHVAGDWVTEIAAGSWLRGGYHQIVVDNDIEG